MTISEIKDYLVSVCCCRRLEEKDKDWLSAPTQSYKTARKKTLDVFAVDQFYDDVRSYDQDTLVDYIQSHRLHFLQQGQATKVRKWKEGRGGEGRSNVFKTSLVVLFNKTVFPTGKRGERERSTPEGPAGKILGKGYDLMAFLVRDLITGQKVVVSQTIRSDAILTLRKRFEVTQAIHSPHILAVECYGVRTGGYKGYEVSRVCSCTLKDKLKENPNYLKEHPQLLGQLAQGIRRLPPRRLHPSRRWGEKHLFG